MTKQLEGTERKCENCGEFGECCQLEKQEPPCKTGTSCTGDCKQCAVEEPVACGNCNGSGRMVRDPDIGTDQECFVCEGSGFYEDTHPQRIAEKQEPVAVWELQESGWETICDGDWLKELPMGTKLYTHPQLIDKSAAIRIATALGWQPQKPWVGLTDEEVGDVFDSVPTGQSDPWWLRYYQALESKLKEKNHG